ncbi:MAG TPA: phosphotransferase [Acidimicrobiia bacterium]|nr:phosphotransferase [Acidimicrobiia bacterium]
MPIPDLSDPKTLSDALAPLAMRPVGDPVTIGEEYGFASSLVRVEVTGADGERSVVVKAWDVTTHGTGEIAFYEQWATRLPIRLASCFGSHADEETGVLVLEDLPVARQGDAAESIEAVDARTIALQIASIHQATRGAEPGIPPPRPSRDAEWHATRRAAHLERHGSPEEPMLGRIVECSERAEALASEVLANATLGLVHGDLHADNVVYLPDDTPVLLDWARPHWGPVADPLASLLLGTAPGEGYTQVIEAIRSVLPLPDAEIHAALLRRLVVATLGTAVWQPETERQHRLVEAGVAQAAAAARWLGEVTPGLIDDLLP